MKLEKFEKWCNFASDGLTKYDLLIALFSLMICALADDLKLETLYSVSGGLVIAIFVWYLCTFICFLILFILKKCNSKKAKLDNVAEDDFKKGD